MDTPIKPIMAAEKKASVRNRKPEIIFFNEEKEEDKRSALSKLRARDESNEKNDDRGMRRSLSLQKLKLETEGINMKTMKKEIRQFNSSTLDDSTSPLSDTEYIKSIGGTGPKPVVVPYPYYLARLKKEKIRKEKELEMLSLTGSQVTSKQNKKRIKVSRSGFWRDRPPRSLDSSIGQFKGGTLKLSSKDIKSFKYKK